MIMITINGCGGEGGGQIPVTGRQKDRRLTSFHIAAG